MGKMEIRVKTKHVVKPDEPTWKTILPLSELDQIGVITHTPLIYIYNKPPKDSLYSSNNQILQAIKDSLSRVLVPFHPLAGRLRWMGGGRLELECNAMGIELIEAESNISMKDFGDFSDFKSFEDLIPHVDYEKPIQEIPLLLVQVTWFQCGAIGLGTAMSHAVTDGLGAFDFMREWAKMANRREPLLGSTPPYLDRGILRRARDPPPLERSIIPPVADVDYFSRLPTLLREEEDKNKLDEDTVATTLVLTKSQVDKLKMIANRGIKNDEERPYGRFEVIAAHVWRCSCKAREHKSEQMTALCFCVDSRSRMDPPLPTRYFGNAIVDVAATSQAGELISRPLSYACRRIREETRKVTNDYVWSLIDFLKAQKSLTQYQERVALGSKEGVCYGNPNLGVASWLNLPVRGLDFGWGKEIYMGPASHDFDGDVMILPGYDNDHASVAVVVGLQVAHMEKFKKFFYEDIDIELAQVYLEKLFIESQPFCSELDSRCHQVEAGLLLSQ